MWNPSSQKLLNIEEDEAGRLKRFRQRFGRGFDVEAMEREEVV
jgi:predicted secreted protein